MEFLNYHHLRYFWTVAKEGGLTRAAAKLHVSQPTISAQIQALEGVLGEKLLRRAGRNLVLTDAGQQVLSYAEEIFSLGQDLLNVVKRRPTSRPLRLNLGVADALPKLVTYRIIEPVFHLPQLVQVSCWETSVSDMLLELASYRLDLVLADEPASSGVSTNVFNHLLGESGVTFCATPSLAARLRRGFPESLDGAPALLPMANTGLRRSLEKWFHSVGVRPRLVGEFYDPALVNILALHGLGFMPVPTVVAREVVKRFGFRLIGDHRRSAAPAFRQNLMRSQSLVAPSPANLVAVEIVLHITLPILYGVQLQYELISKEQGLGALARPGVMLGRVCSHGQAGGYCA
jgi:LysR family transcriptional activator of nhaA